MFDFDRILDVIFSYDAKYHIIATIRQSIGWTDDWLYAN